MSGQEPDVPHIQEAVARAIRRLRRTLVVAALVLALGVCAASLWWSPPQWGAGVVGAAGIALLMVVTRWVLDHMLADPSNPVPWVAISYVGKALVIAASVVPVKLWGGEVALPGLGMVAAVLVFSFLEVLALSRIRMGAVDARR